jgi:hypothetical protein
MLYGNAMRRTVISRCLIAALLCAGSIDAASAQMALPGGGDPTLAPMPDASASAKSKPKPKTAATLEAKIDSVLGKTLKLNGADGAMVIARHGDALTVEKLTLKGESTADAGAPCTIDVRGDAPIALKSMGKVEGLAHYSIDFPACPLEFDLLDKATLVPQQAAACVFQAASCQANPGGLWGPGADELQTSAKEIAAKRQKADAVLSASLNALMKRNKGKDSAKVSGDEEAFAGQRDEICKGYDGEATLGFCGSRVTMARAANLASKLKPQKAEASAAQ